MNIFTKFIIKLIKGYKFLISPLFGNTCRYLPTCSEYCIDCLKEFGLIKGIFMSFKRILSCHPWGKGGFDPVKKEMKVKKNGI
jgi:putative membrane protein insertion efficiency factor